MGKKMKLNNVFAALAFMICLALNAETAMAETKNSIGSMINMPSVTKGIFITVCLVAIAVFALAVYWAVKNKPEKKLRRNVKYVFLSLALVIVVVINFAASTASVFLGQFLLGRNVDENEVNKTYEESRNLVEEIANEGFVLLENKNKALPLDLSKETEKNINIFGQNSVDITYGGGGSGSGDESKNIDLKTGLENAGFKVNAELTDFYKDAMPEAESSSIFNLIGGDYNLSQPATSDFSDEMLANAREFSDVALVVFSRKPGEGGDFPTDTTNYGGDAEHNYLQLSAKEEELLDMVKFMDFEKVIVIVNSTNPMELGFLEDEGIDGAVWVGAVGSTGTNSIGNVLSGKINPSGRLIDTYAYDSTSAPSYFNVGDFNFTNTEYVDNSIMGGGKTTYHKFMNYNEGIYVGYRFYETRFIDNKTGQCDEEAYSKVVQYPFGYGLSYTKFKQEIAGYKTSNDVITVDVKVTNTGNTAGKEVVQLYFTAPYYEGGIEKSHVVLADFGKTQILEPGASETITIELPVEEMASYDYINEKAYVLDEGKYEIKLMKNSHKVMDSKEYEVAERVVFGEDNKRSSDGVVATNQFDDMNADFKYVSRADWEGTLPTEIAKDTEAPQAVVDELLSLEVKDNPEDEDIVFADHGLELKDMVGLEYNDPKWDQLLEQLSINEMERLIGFGAFATQPIKSINKPMTIDIDGPAGLNGLSNGIRGVQYCSEVVVASTWNVELVEKMGETIGNEALANGVSGIYGAAVNIHRTPYGGRDFEYYAEDPVVAGNIASALIRGAESKGVYYYLKHFALNDQETNRLQVTIWTNEQAFREIYLRAFEIPVKEANAKGVMTSVNRIGATWPGASYELCTTVLRDEWGFEGMVVTDNCMGDYADPDQAIRAGNDLMLAPIELAGDAPTERSSESNTGKQAMRKASKNILYVVANSAAFDSAEKIAFPTWTVILGVVDALLLALIGFGFYRAATKKYKKKEKKNKKKEPVQI